MKLPYRYKKAVVNATALAVSLDFQKLNMDFHGSKKLATQHLYFHHC